MKAKRNESPHFINARIRAQVIEDILRAMDDQGLTQSHFAEKLGRSRQSVWELLRKEPNVSLERLVSIASALDWQLVVRLISRNEAAVIVPASLLPEARALAQKQDPRSIRTGNAGERAAKVAPPIDRSIEGNLKRRITDSSPYGGLGIGN